jgi:hypothetical protein
MNKEICLKCPRKSCYIVMGVKDGKADYYIGDSLWNLALNMGSEGISSVFSASGVAWFIFQKWNGQVLCLKSNVIGDKAYSEKLGREVSKEEVIDFAFRKLKIGSKSGCVCCTEHMVDGWNGEDEDRER